MQEIEAAHPKDFRVRRSKSLRLSEGVGPGDGGVGEDPFGQIGFDLAEGFLALLDGDLLPKDTQTNRVVQFVPVEGCER